jgi:hypothetical protein
MIIKFIYEPDYPRIIFACMMDARAGTPLANKPGTIQKEFIDAEIAKVTSEVIPYRLESELGVIIGYISLKTGNMGQTAVLFQETYRPAFANMIPEIQQNISKFVSSLAWRGDILI